MKVYSRMAVVKQGVIKTMNAVAVLTNEEVNNIREILMQLESWDNPGHVGVFSWLGPKKQAYNDFTDLKDLLFQDIDTITLKTYKIILQNFIRLIFGHKKFMNIYIELSEALIDAGINIALPAYNQYATNQTDYYCEVNEETLQYATSCIKNDERIANSWRKRGGSRRSRSSRKQNRKNRKTSKSNKRNRV